VWHEVLLCALRIGVGRLRFFFQAEDGIRVFHVTGVQTCALPICSSPATVAAVGSIAIAGMVRSGYPKAFGAGIVCNAGTLGILKIGRASCRERGEDCGDGGAGWDREARVALVRGRRGKVVESLTE